MTQFKTLQFPNNPEGQADKNKTLQHEYSMGWRVISERIEDSQMELARSVEMPKLTEWFCPCLLIPKLMNINKKTQELIKKGGTITVNLQKDD